MSSLLECSVPADDRLRARDAAGAAAQAVGHIPALDGIRGLAVLMVLVFHIFQVESHPQQPALRVLYALTTFGQTGVDLFFVLSGFLITGILYDAKESRRYFLNFYGRRALRIFPLYYGFSLVMLSLFPGLLGFRVTGLTWLDLGTFSANFALATGRDGGMMGHFWSLAIEEQFYLVWPMVVYALGRRALMSVCLASMGVAAVLRWIVESHGISSFMLTPCRMDTLLVGALLALAARGPLGLIEWSRRAMIVAIAALSVAFPLCLIMRGSGSVWLQVVKYPLIAVLYGAIVVIAITAARRSWTGRLLIARPLRSLGHYSYGIYVYHPPLIHLVGRIFGLTSVALPFPGAHPSLDLVARVILIAGGSCAIAWVSWHAFERPFLSLKRYFEYDVRKPPEVDAGAHLYNGPAGGNDRSFTLGLAKGVDRASVFGESS